MKAEVTLCCSGGDREQPVKEAMSDIRSEKTGRKEVGLMDGWSEKVKEGGGVLV